MKFVEIDQGVCPCTQGDSLPKRDIFDIFGPDSHHPALSEMKFCTDKRTHDVHVGHAKFHMNRCNELPMWGEVSE